MQPRNPSLQDTRHKVPKSVIIWPPPRMGCNSIIKRYHHDFLTCRNLKVNDPKKHHSNTHGSNLIAEWNHLEFYAKKKTKSIQNPSWRKKPLFCPPSPLLTTLPTPTYSKVLIILFFPSLIVGIVSRRGGGSNKPKTVDHCSVLVTQRLNESSNATWIFLVNNLPSTFSILTSKFCKSVHSFQIPKWDDLFPLTAWFGLNKTGDS